MAHGRWAAVEIKLGGGQAIAEAMDSLSAVRSQIDTTRRGEAGGRYGGESGALAVLWAKTMENSLQHEGKIRHIPHCMVNSPP